MGGFTFSSSRAARKDRARKFFDGSSVCQEETSWKIISLLILTKLQLIIMKIESSSFFRGINFFDPFTSIGDISFGKLRDTLMWTPFSICSAKIKGGRVKVSLEFWNLVSSLFVKGLVLFLAQKKEQVSNFWMTTWNFLKNYTVLCSEAVFLIQF